MPGKGWDAGSVRIVTVGDFVHRPSGREVVGLCTHFDNQGVVSRAESAKLILRIVDEITKGSFAWTPSTLTNSTSTNTTTTTHHTHAPSTVPIFLSGDLNSDPDDKAFQTLNARNSSLEDTKELAGWKYGDNYTFTGFTGSSEDLALIDHVMLNTRRAKGLWTVRGYSVLPNLFEDGVYISDHRAVVGDVVLRV